MGNKNTSNIDNNTRDNKHVILNNIDNNLTTTLNNYNNSSRHQRPWYERQDFYNKNNNNQRCLLLQQLEQTIHGQQQLQQLMRHFDIDSKYDNNDKSENIVNKSFQQSFVEKSSFSPLQYVKRKFSFKKQDKEHTSPWKTSLPSPTKSLSIPAPIHPMSSLSVSSSSSPPLPQTPLSRYAELKRTDSYNKILYSTKTNNDSYNNNNNTNIYYHSDNNNNYMYNDNNNIDIIDGYLMLGSSNRQRDINNHLECPSLPVLSSHHYTLPTITDNDVQQHHESIPPETSEHGKDRHSIKEGESDDQLIQNKNDECVDLEKFNQMDATEFQWMIEDNSFPSSPDWKLKKKKKIRTNPWIAQSSIATPPSSPDTSHLTTPGVGKVTKNQFLKKKYSIKACGDCKDEINTSRDSRKQDAGRGMIEDGLTRPDDDINSCSEGYYSSSFGSISGYSMESPGSSPLKMKKFVPEANDSGFFSMLNSCTGYPSEGGTVDIALPRGSEFEESVDMDVDRRIRKSSVDEEDMPLPCSRDLIAINNLLRMKQIEKQSITCKPVKCEIRNNNYYEMKSEEIFDLSTSEIENESVIISETSTNEHQPVSRLRKISYEIENQIFELKHDFYDDVFGEKQNKLLMDDPITFQHEELAQHLRAPGSDYLFDDFSSEEEDDTIENQRTLEEIQTNLEATYRELWTQDRNIKERMDRHKEEEELKMKELKIMKEEAIENKKIFLLHTLQRLKVCLDEQKAWLQRTYDNILEKKWPVLHQVMG